MKPSSRTNLKRLLSERNQHPERAAHIDATIHQAFTSKVAILVLDMCGFSQLTASHGVIHFLAMVHQMEQGARPAIIGNGGRVIKQEADNLFAVFDAPIDALEAGLDICRAFEAMNTVLPEARQIHVSVGIGFGDTLIVDEADMYGHEMNIACKLGEDIAGKMEMLLSQAAHATLPAARYACSAATTTIGGNSVGYYRFERCLYPRDVAASNAPD